MTKGKFKYTITRLHSRANNALAEIDASDKLVAHGKLQKEVVEDRGFVRVAMLELLNVTDIRESDVTLELLNQIEKIVNRVIDTNRVAGYQIQGVLDYMDSALDELFPEVMHGRNQNKNNAASDTKALTTLDSFVNKAWKPWTAVLAAGTVVLAAVEVKNWLGSEAGKQKPTTTPIEDIQPSTWLDKIGKAPKIPNIYEEADWTEKAARVLVKKAFKQVKIERE